MHLIFDKLPKLSLLVFRISRHLDLADFLARLIDNLSGNLSKCHAGTCCWPTAWVTQSQSQSQPGQKSSLFSQCVGHILCKQKQIQILSSLLCYMFGNANQHPQIVVEGKGRGQRGRGHRGRRQKEGGWQAAGYPPALPKRTNALIKKMCWPIWPQTTLLVAPSSV